MNVSGEEIVQILNMLNLEKILVKDDVDVNLNEIGLNSLEYIKFTILLEEYYGIKNCEEVLFKILQKITVRNIMECLRTVED